MNATYSDLNEEERIDITVEFVSRRVLDSGGNRVCRLLVEDDTGSRFAIFVTPDKGFLGGLRTGGKYTFTGLLGSAPSGPVSRGTPDCPACGGPLRRGVVADAVDTAITDAVSPLGVEQLFAIIDEQTTVSRAERRTDVVDDWQPMNVGGKSESAVTAPDYVCSDCGRTLDSRELHENQGEIVDSVANESPAAAPSRAAPETVGLATGGAKDVENFRENIANGYTPQPESISTEGLFYDYYFETGERTESDALFAPRYAAAARENPLTGETDQFLSVGLDSTLALEDFQRPQLDIVTVLDVSGSMNSQFDSYYYDEHGRERETESGSETKLEAATEALCALTERLRDDDRLGVVLYNHRAHVAKPLRDVGSTDMDAIRGHIRDIAAGGSTNLADGFEAAVDMLVEDAETGEPGYEEDVERRVVFMTDMMPNTGTTDESSLTQLFEDATTTGIHTTFVGMGIGANAEFADTLSGIRGANHYFVQSGEEFEQRLGDEFGYMVTPLVYDLELELVGEGHEIAAVHGSPSADKSSGQLMQVETLFPSAKEDGEARGGVVLVEVEQVGAEPEMELVASWTERDGSEHDETVTVELPTEPGEYDHTGIRKAIALARYAGELRDWTGDVHERANGSSGVDDWLLPDQRSKHERESIPLVVPAAYAERFSSLRDYLHEEMDALDDSTLQQELNLLETLCQKQPERPFEVTE
ncbi:VWA domain-containing protein [Haloarchaeobius sp. FL176]|uniref:vWA domain-containing protein n=1 Tax=Haloarchaeobius sp. FL176 TaxID=2967129 RepID=UPI0021477463|nr:VWA domain-containing protein [Haloarchaeobius sp. FL176]